MPSKTIPFKNLNADAWRNLALAAVAFFYITNFFALLFKIGVENGVGGDFFAYWNAGKAANIYGFSQIYDLDTLEQVQLLTLKQLGFPVEETTPVLMPFLYLSIFLIPFYFLSFLSLPAGYWFWTIFNFLALIFYLLFLIKNFSGENVSSTYKKILLLSLLLSYPVCINFLKGQIELVNLICCGEFLRHAVKKKPLISGLWLGGMLLKPQLLILVVLALFLLKNLKVIHGFMISAAGIVITSVAISGVEGSLKLLKLWTDTDQLYSSFAPENMANWRMIGIIFNNFTSSSLGWILTIVGTIATVIVCFIFLRRRPVMGTNPWVTALFAIFAASCLISWHSHIHSSMVLLPFLLITQLTRSLENHQRILDLFVFSFPVVLMGGSVIKIIFMALQLPPDDNLVVFLLGLAGIIVYLTILITVVKTNTHGRPVFVNLSEKPPTD